MPDPRWTVDEFETYTIHGPNRERIRCYDADGTEASPRVAKQVVAAIRDAARLPELETHVAELEAACRNLLDPSTLRILQIVEEEGT